MYLILHVTLQDHLIKGTVIVCKHRVLGIVAMEIVLVKI